MRFLSAGKLAGIFAVLMVIGPARTATAAPLLIVSESVEIDIYTLDVRFILQLNQVPDFYTLDRFGRSAHSVQWYVLTDPGVPTPPFRYDTIVRVEELPGTGIRIRNVGPRDPDPGSGGWGPIRLAVPYTLEGSLLTFSAPLSALSNRNEHGFVYRLTVGEYGATSQGLLNHNKYAPIPVAVPEPVTAVSFSLGMLGLFLHRRRRSRRSAGLKG